MALPGNPIDPTRCPVCGEPNACAMEIERRTGQPQPQCWCTQASFDPGLLASLPAPAWGEACICAACARAARERPPASAAARE